MRYGHEICIYQSTALVEATKSLAPSNVIRHGKVPYQRPWLKSIDGTWHIHVRTRI